jgi:hypothetical protein
MTAVKRAVKRQNAICILDTDTNPQIPQTTVTLTTADQPEWIDDRSNRGISWNEVEDAPPKK